MDPSYSQDILTIHDEENLTVYSLVLSSANISHQVTPLPSGKWAISVREKDRHRAEYEIETYKSENKNWPPKPYSSDSFTPLFKAQSLLITGSLILFFAVTGPWSGDSFWFGNGSANSRAILEGQEYFRLLTSLTLHADIVHLLGNCFLGAILLHYFFHIVGNGIGMMLLLVSSSAANYINSLAHGPGHNSVGFSTAVFAVIGILSALNYNRYRFKRPLQLLMPLMSGMALLAMLGSSGERTDLGAHFFGLLAGLLAGAILVIPHIFQYRRNITLQTLLSVFGFLLPILAWILAIR